jgi:hypothetical protein
MQYNGPTFYLPPTWPERLYLAGIIIENALWLWAISRWRGATELAEVFLWCGYGHLSSPPPGVPLMFCMEEVRAPTA